MPGLGDLFGSAAGGSTVGRAVVEIVGDSARLRQDFAKTEAETEASMSKMGKAAQSFGFIAQAGMTIAAAAAVKFGVDSVKAFEESEAANIKLQNSLLNNPKAASLGIEAFRDQATELQRLTGVQDETIQGSQAMLAQFDLTGKQISDLVPLIVDLSQKMGIDMTAATKAVGKATAGSAGILARYGIVLDKDALAADAFGTVMDGLRSKVGGFAEAEAGTLSGQLRILNTQFDELKENAGSIAVPLLIPLAKGLTEVTSAASDNENVLTRLGNIFLRINGPVGGLIQISDVLRAKFEQQGAVVDASVDALGKWTTQLERGQISGSQFRDLVDNLAQSAKDNGASEETVQQILSSGRSVLQGYANDILGIADAHKTDQAEARKTMLAELALVGGFLGIRGAALSAKSAQTEYADAQAEVNKLAAHGKKGTIEYRDAVQQQKEAQLGALESQLGLASAVAKYVDQQKGDSKTSQQDINNLTREYGKQAGLTSKEISTLIGTVQSLIPKFDQLPESKKTNVSAPGIDETSAKVERLLRGLNNIKSIYATDVMVRYTSVGSPNGPHPIAAGAVLAGESGFITKGPTFLVGESARQTFAGRGAEGVIPFDDRGIGILSEALSRALGKMTPGGGQHGGVPFTLVLELPWGRITREVTAHQGVNKVLLGGR